MPIIKRSKVQLVDGPPAPLPAQRGAEHAPEEGPERCDKEVRLVRLGGEVRALELRCSCGETTTIELAYGEAETKGAEAPAEETQ